MSDTVCHTGATVVLFHSNQIAPRTHPSNFSRVKYNVKWEMELIFQ